MRKFLLILLIFIYKNTFSQLNDNFSDGNFNQTPEWRGVNSSTNFIIADGQLRSNSTISGNNFYLAVPNSKATNCIWEFYSNLRFATSGSNYVDFYLVSDTENLLSTSINGYFVRMGNTSDEISLYKRSGSISSIVKIIDGRDGLVNSTTNNTFKIKIARSSSGEFVLERDSTGTGNHYRTEGSFLDNSFISTNWFGIVIQQSVSSFHQKHFFDDFSISDIVTDITPPQLTNLSIIDSNKIELTFDETLDLTHTSILNNYLITPGNIQPSSINIAGQTVVLNLSSGLNSGNYSLNINSLKDLNGNVIPSPIISNFNYKKPYIAKANDIVINEIFADPSPQIDLPTVEFIELWNRTLEDISLKDFQYKDASTSFTFSQDSIKANEYLILCAKADTAEFKRYGKVIGLAPWPSLNNAADQISIVNQNGTLIHQVNYSDTWHKDATKKSGGYSLELIDPLSTCRQSQNYSSSTDPSGGTPGKVNSIYLANKTADPLTLVSVSLEDSVTVSIIFNRGLDSLQASLPNHYQINNGVGAPQFVTLSGPNFSTVKLKYTNTLTRNANYTLTVNNVSDCGNGIINNQTLNFIYPGVINKNDILINEILFNPRSDGADFVEVYNNSDKVLDFKDLSLGTTNDKDSLVSIKNISSTSILFEPKTYWVLSADPDYIKTSYQTSAPNNFIKLTSMPSFNDDQGVAVIINPKKERIDQLTYHKDMHFGLLKDPEGVSLERSSFLADANKKGNFRSATSSVGYATPAYKNSQYLELNTSPEEISLSSTTFSPDNDGFEDVLSINYNLNSTDFVANITIYNDQGRLIKKLINNETVSSTGNWIWDGLDLDNIKAKTGIYIIYIEFFNLNAEVKKFKKTVVVASKF